MKVAGWLRRHLAFASPFVIVAACWRSSEPVEPVEPAAAREPAPLAAIAPSDALTETPITADAPPVTTVPIDAAELADAAAARINPLPAHRRPPTANPPSTTASSPAAIIARVIAISVTGGTIIVTVAAGSNQGVARNWSCQLIDQDDQPAQDDGCMIVRVDKVVTVLKVKLTFDQIRAHRRARLTPPP
jgi:hypothetical protein